MADDPNESSEDEELSDNEESDNYNNKTWGRKSGVIFLIDARQNMFLKNESGESHFTKSLRCCETTMLNKIVSNDLEHIGVILYGTKAKDSNSNLKNIKTIISLDKPNAPALKQLKVITNNNGPEVDDYKKEIGISDQYSLGNALWLSSLTFSVSDTKYHNRTILLFTNDCNPHKDDPKEQQLARIKAKDLADIGIQLQLLHLGTDFDAAVFYQEFLEIINKETGDWTLPNPAETLENLLNRVNRRSARKLRLSKLKWNLGHGVCIGVGLYNLYRKTTIPIKENLDRATNETVKSVRQNFHSENGALLLPSDLVYVLQRAGETIEFTPEEKKMLNYMTDPGLTLLGFKPSSCVKMEHQFKPSSFIYPEEELVKGSRQLFVALLDRCLELDKVAVCAITPAKNRHPYIVLLKPQKEILDETGTQSCPSGFHVFYLPFSDCLRDIPMEEAPKVTNDQIQIAKNVIRKLCFRYSHRTLENPKLQTHWSNIEALALEYEKPREVNDDTVPDLESMKQRLGSLAESFMDAVYPSGYNPEKGSKTLGKRCGETSLASKSKIPKSGHSHDIGKLVHEMKVESLTVNELKNYLSNFPDVKTTGLKKASLVELVYKMYSN